MSSQHSLSLPTLSEMYVVMSNALARSAHSLTLPEKRLIAACIAKTKQSWPPGFDPEDVQNHIENWGDWEKMPNGPFTVRLSAADFAKAYDVDISHAYTQMQVATEKLWDRYVRTKIKTATGVEDGKFRWVQAVKYKDAQGWVELTWSFQVAQHVYAVAKEFSRYKLQSAQSLESVYSWRLFELLNAHREEGRPYAPTIGDFILAMDAPEGYSKDFASIRRRIIDTAIKELKEKKDIDVTYTTINAGRKVIGIKFEYASNPQLSLLSPRED